MPEQSESAAPTFKHTYRSARGSNGKYTIFDVPVFTETGKYDEAWLGAALDVAKKREERGYFAPIHLHHHDDKGGATEKNKGAGFMRAKRVAPIEVVLPNGDVETKSAYFVDMAEIPADVYADVKAVKYPFRSAEVLRPSVPDLSSLALMETEVPFHRLPVLNVEEPAERFSFRHAGALIEDEMPEKNETPAEKPAAEPAKTPEAPAKFADGKAPVPPPPGAPDGGAPEEPAKPAAPAPEASGLNVHAATILKSIAMQLNALLSGHEEAKPKPEPTPEPTPEEEPEMPADKKTPPAVAAVPEQFSDAAMAALAKQAATNANLKRAAQKTDEARIGEAVQRFSAKNLVHDAEEFKASITEIGLKGEQIEKFAEGYEKHLLPAPPKPGAGIGLGGTHAGGESPRMFLAADSELKKFTEQGEDVQRFAAMAAKDYDGSPTLKNLMKRADYVEGFVARNVREARNSK